MTWFRENYEQLGTMPVLLKRYYEKETDPEKEVHDRKSYAVGNMKDQVDLATLDRANKVPFNLSSPTQCPEAMPLCGLIGEILALFRTMLCLTRKGSED